METTSAASLLLALGLILIGARIAGALARQLGQPRVLGELIVGVVLGPTLLNILHSTTLNLEGSHLDSTIHHLAELGVMVLMFMVGLDVHVSELRKVGKVAVLAGILGAVVPVALVIPALLLFNYAWQPALFAGVTLAATSVSISAQVLLELGRLNTRIGHALLATALVDDVIAILLVSLTIAVTTTTSGAVDAGALVGIIARMAVYIGVAVLIARYMLPVLLDWVYRHPPLSQSFGVPAFALVCMLFFGWSAEAFGGVAAITGAFIAGAGLSRANEAVKRQVDHAVDNIAYAFLVPIFFINVGLQTDLRTFTLDAVPLAVVLLVAALISKVIGSGVGAVRAGFNRSDATQLGICMISRGEVGLIIMSLGLSSGILQAGDALFASLFLTILLTTLITPILVRYIFREPPAAVEVEG